MYPRSNIEYGLRDKYDQGSGLMQVNPNELQVTAIEYSLTVDTRDCIGSKSLADAQFTAQNQGIRPEITGTVNYATATTPVVVTVNSSTGLKVGDLIYIEGVLGMKGVNGDFFITSVVGNNITLDYSEGYGTYSGSGVWMRPGDGGYPQLTPQDSSIRNNQIVVSLNKKLKNLRTLSLYNIVIPRDIIPLIVYLPDFITDSTDYTNTIYPGTTTTDYTTFIPQEEKHLMSRLLGFFSSPLDVWRAYDNSSMSMPDQVTNPPLQLWNPPLGPWPLQPISYPFQTVPTYVSEDFAISGQSGLFHIVLSGYGVYDLLDWTSNTGNPVVDVAETEKMRKMLLLLITQSQSYRDQDHVNLILNCTTTNTNIYPFGYGNFQRFIPGPGVNQTYQPGTNIIFPGDPTVASADSPVPFPNFRGNIYGPYNTPDSRFQKLGTRTLIQDLYLNGDLNNLLGSPLILSDVPTENIATHITYGLNFPGLVEVNLGNISSTTNLNILNAMRIVPNGFGATTIRANGSGSLYTNRLNGTSGGQGPSSLGVPSAWVNNGIYTTGYTDPIAQGPLASNITASSADASYTGDINVPRINHNTSFYDLGPQYGYFLQTIAKYIDFASNDLPDTDLIIRIEEAERTIRAQSTNSMNGDALLDCPIRLNIGSTNGTQQYIESIQPLISNASYYWEHRYMAPLGKLEKLHINFYAYDGTPIPLENMLQERKQLYLQRLFQRIGNVLDISNFTINYLFDPLDPRLIGREKRYIQIIFKANCYDTMSPGLAPESYQGIPPYVEGDDEMNIYG